VSSIDVEGPARPGSVARTQLLCLWTVPFFGCALVIASLVFPGFFPPMSPQMSAQEVADFYQQHIPEIRFSMVVFNLFGVMLAPFFAVTAVQMMRMATPSKVLGIAYMTATASGATVFALADIFFLLAAFRPERDPNLIMLLNDLAWIVLVAPVGMIFVQNLCLALAVYLDARDRPVMPRWVAGFSLVIAAAIAPAAGAAVTTTGPFAWDGVLAFWLRFGALAVFIAVMFVVLRRAINDQVADETAEADRAVVR
jgi:hypothetical protein